MSDSDSWRTQRSGDLTGYTQYKGLTLVRGALTRASGTQ